MNINRRLYNGVVNQISTTQVVENDNGWEFSVKVDDFNYKVSLDREYYQKLTDGSVDPQNLIEKSFEFLLDNEPPGYILKEFDLRDIIRYFPNYETKISRNI